MDKKWKKGMDVNTIEDFRDFASGITRNEFERGYLKCDGEGDEYSFYPNDNENSEINCPNYLDLTEDNNCPHHSNCKKCWIESVENIYFKDDIENSSLKLDLYLNKSVNRVNKIKDSTKQNNTKVKRSITCDYNREYTLYEIFEFEDNTEFTYGEFRVRVNDNILETMDNGENSWYQCTICRDWMKGLYKLVPVEKEVTFQEILNIESNCKCKVEHELINDLDARGLSEYMYFTAYMSNLIRCNELYTNDIKEIIREGRWYIGGEN